MVSSHIALLDDEPDITTLLSHYLQGHGFRVSVTHSSSALMALMERDPAGLVLLDLGLPGDDGLAVARALRERFRCGLIIVSGRGDAIDKVVGLELGADDYVTKPFDLRELLARIKAVIRRLEEARPAAPVAALRERWAFEGWTLDVAARRLCRPDGQEVALTGGEFDLLLSLLRNAGQVLSRDFLLDATRGREAGPFDRTIDVQVGRLRRKIEAVPEDPRWIKSVRSAGYVFVAGVQRV
jgi:DNA-binding response OmpR family regulator